MIPALMVQAPAIPAPLHALAAAAPPEFRLASPAWLHALWLALAALLLAGYAAAGRRRALVRTADPRVAAGLTASLSLWRRRLRAWALAAALALLALALARPQDNPRAETVRRTGRDIAFVVDVSRSMLSTDLAPNRLERAKLWIRDLAATLGGERLALVAFAGESSVRCPLTLDKGFFVIALDELSPADVPRGGTLIGDAIRRTVGDVFGLSEPTGDDDPAAQPARPGSRLIVLVTDGGDQESLPVAAAEAAGRLGVRVIALGLGTPGEGVRIPDPESDGFITYRGREVRSSLDTETLREVAAATPGGAFLEIGTGDIDLPAVFRDLTASAERTAIGEATATRYRELYWPLAAAAFALLAAESLTGERRRRP